MPAEYAALKQAPTQWKVTDVLAEASLIGGIFGKGGGAEVRSALALQALEKQLGKSLGRATWTTFREHNDPEAPVTISKSFPYETGAPFSKSGLAIPKPGTVSFVKVGEELGAPSASQMRSSRVRPARLTNAALSTDTPAPQAIPNDGSIGSQLMRQSLAGAPHASNSELVNASHSTNGHAIAVMGPQVGYFVPEVLMEEDLHGPGIDARGAAFPGVNLYVELGHGRDYAWSATTATSDNVDTFAEVVCQDEFHYLYKGNCLPMDKLEKRNTWTPNATDQTAPGSEKLTIYRTVHGLVYARGKVGGKDVALASARTTYFHEADGALGFSDPNAPGIITGPKRTQEAVSKISSPFIWSYAAATTSPSS